jgi:predicted Zn-dependent peptidase
MKKEIFVYLHRSLIALSLTCVLPLWAAADDGVKTPPFERVKLPNGAVMLLMERHDVPLIAFNANIRGGAAVDPSSALGTASLLAALLDKGAGARDANAFAETVASVGGEINTGAGPESISVSGSFLARDQQLMIELLADVLQRPKLQAEQFETLRARHIEYVRAAKDSELSRLTPLYGAAALYGSHPYGRPVNGSEASLAAIKQADVTRFYQEHVGADRLIVAVAGDFKTLQMKQMLQRAFSGWRKAGAPLPALTKPAPMNTRRVLLVDAPDAVQSYFWAANLGVAKNDPRRAALDVVNTVFGGRFTSMLNTELRIRTGLTYGANTRFNRLSQWGDWQLSSFTRTEKTIEAIDLAFATLDKLHVGGLDAAQLDSSKRYLQGQFPPTLETAVQWAGQLASFEFYGLSRDYIDGYSAAVAAVSLDDAKRVISEVVPASDRVVLVVIGKAAAIRDGLRKYGPIVEMKLSDPQFQKP